MKKALGLFAVGLSIAFALWLNTVIPPKAYNEVTLRSGPSNPLVPMWQVVGTGPNDAVHEFPSGTDCTVIIGPAYYDVAGTLLEYYKLTCHGVSGYVSSQWVN